MHRLAQYLLARKPTILALSACLILLIVLWNRVLTNRRTQAPGPRGLPFIGNTLQLSGRTWLLFDKWKKEYGRLSGALLSCLKFPVGPIISVSIAGREFVVLNTSKVAFELLTKRATKYSDRPRLIVAGELLTNGMHIAFARYGDL